MFRLPHAVQLSGEATLQSAPVNHHAATSQHRSVVWPPATSQRCSPKNNGATPGSCHNHAATTRCCVTVLPTSSHLPNNHRGRGWNQADPPNQPQGGRGGIKLTCPTNCRAAQPTNHRGEGGGRHAATTQSGARIYHAAALQRRGAVTTTLQRPVAALSRCRELCVKLNS